MQKINEEKGEQAGSDIFQMYTASNKLHETCH
jgi:hypothetical protein